MYDRDDYRRDFNQAKGDATWTAWRVFWWMLAAAALIAVVGFIWTMLSRPAQIAEKVTDPDKIISDYEEFQNLYNACQKLDADLKTICSTPDGDAMFAQFSKGAMVAQKRQLITRWVNEYNAKSKMFTRQYWKSGSLPYQLNEEDFPNYNCLQRGATK